MVVNEWHNNGPQDTSQYLCAVSLSITYACPYHNHRHHGPLDPQPRHQRTAHPHDAIHLLPCTEKTRIHPWREHLSKVPDAVECEHLPIQVSYDDELQSGRDPDEDEQMSFPETVSDRLCRNSLVMQTVWVACLRRSWRWRCWMWRSWAGGLAPLEMAYGREMNIQFSRFGALLKGLTSVEDISCRSRDSIPQPQVTSPTLYPLEPRLPPSCCLISILICHTCEVDDYLGKGEVLTNTDLDRFMNNIWEK